jgi:PAS domain-containing protein
MDRHAGGRGPVRQFSGALIDASPVAIIQEDLDEHVTAWNPAAEALFG